MSIFIGRKEEKMAETVETLSPFEQMKKILSDKEAVIIGFGVCPILFKKMNL